MAASSTSARIYFTYITHYSLPDIIPNWFSRRVIHIAYDER